MAKVIITLPDTVSEQIEESGIDQQQTPLVLTYRKRTSERW